MVSVPSRQAVPLAAPPQSGDSLLFAADDPVLPSHPGSPVFGELRWDLSILGLAANQVPGDAVLNFGRFLDPVSLGPAGGPAGPLRLAPAWLLRAKEVLAILLAPTRRTRHGRIDVYAATGIVVAEHGEGGKRPHLRARRVGDAERPPG